MGYSENTLRMTRNTNRATITFPKHNVVRYCLSCKYTTSEKYKITKLCHQILKVTATIKHLR